MLQENSVYCMDYLDLLGQLEAQSVDLLLTDPPYNTTAIELSPEYVDIARKRLDMPYTLPMPMGE